MQSLCKFLSHLTKLFPENLLNIAVYDYGN